MAVSRRRREAERAQTYVPALPSQALQLSQKPHYIDSTETDVR